MTIANSYTSADGFPIKVLRSTELLETIRELGIIPPIHVQLIPTNKCNLNCDFCSCSDEDRTKEASLSDLYSIIADMARLGTQAVSITGGGDPMLHPDINDIIKTASSFDIDVGLVTNGTLIGNLDVDEGDVTWCRISNGDRREFTDRYKYKLAKAVYKNDGIDWAFSHVVSQKPNIKEITRIINFANSYGFTHVRLVSDLMMPEKVDMQGVASELGKRGVDTGNVIFQERVFPPSGGSCYICYLKPVISADLKVFACCGAQYAIDGSEHKLPDELCLGNAADLERIMESSNKPLDGSICDRCYYTAYNDLLGKMLTETEHSRFV